MKEELNSLFYPKSVAVVGVSNNPKKLSSVIFNNIAKYGYEGALVPVNPKYSELFGYKCFKSLNSIDIEIDLAVIVIPTEYVFDSIKDCARKGVKNAVIITAGFSETGAEGKMLERNIADYARKHNIRIVGPNCLGIISTGARLNASFAAQQPDEGNIGFISQSGAFNTAMLDLSESKLLGFEYFVSLGNKSDVDEISLLDAWYKDTKVSVIGAYLEEFGNGLQLIEKISNNPQKPLIILHSGVSAAGKKAAASHTGSLAGSAKSISNALKQSGAIQVDSIERMFSNLMIFSWSPLPKGENVCIVTNAGGPGIIMTDQLEAAGLKLAQLSKQSKTQLSKVLPPHASVNNPVDILGDALSDRYKQAIEIVATDENVDSIIVLLTPQLVTQIEETSKLLIDLRKSITKPIIPVYIGQKYVLPGLERLWENKIPAFQFDEEAVFALKSLTEYALRLADWRKVRKMRPLKGSYTKEIQKVIKSDKSALPAELTRDIALESGLDLPEEKVIKTYNQALQFIVANKFPVVLKATTDNVVHKIDEELVYLNIYTEEDLHQSFRRLQQTLQRITNSEEPDVLIQEQIKANEELILGVNKDNNFGHMLLFGKGGIYTEIYKDTALRLINTDHDELFEMVNQTKVSKILKGARGLEILPIDKVVKSLESLQNIIRRYPEIKSIDINPAMITVNRCIAVDVKIFV